jgi:hypothetical protein
MLITDRWYDTPPYVNNRAAYVNNRQMIWHTSLSNVNNRQMIWHTSLSYVNNRQMIWCTVYVNGEQKFAIHLYTVVNDEQKFVIHLSMLRWKEVLTPAYLNDEQKIWHTWLCLWRTEPGDTIASTCHHVCK